MTQPNNEGRSPKAQLAAGRIKARQKVPFLSHAIMSMVPKEAPGLNTMGVTKNWMLLWDPEWLLTLTLDEVAAVLVHEVSHLLRDHAGRCAAMAADHSLWNIAADMEINDDIALMQMPLPKRAVYPKTRGCKDGEVAESYYHQLRQHQPPKPQQQGKGDKGEGQEGDKKPDEGEGEGGQGQPKVAQGWCGSGGGKPLPNEGDDTDGNGNRVGRSDVEAAGIRRQTAEEIKKQSAKSQGSVPGGWQVWADTIIAPPKVNWAKELARNIRGDIAVQAGAVNYTMSRPSRRQGALGWGKGRPVLPTLRAPKPRVIVGLDTSGSMSGDAIERAAAEIAGILRTVKADVEFIACDSEIHTVTKIRSTKDFSKAFQGGGGTSFVPVFEHVDKMRSPGLFVFLTDGGGDAPAVQPSNIKNVIWVLCGRHKTMPYKQGGGHVDWGKFIEVNDDEVGR